MDRKIWNFEKSVVTGDFISALEFELPKMAEPREKIDEIKNILIMNRKIIILFSQ